MYLKLDNIISKKDINFFIISSFFILFLVFILSKGFIDNEELSDLVFLTSSVILFEFLYLLISNNKINYSIKTLKDYITVYIIFLLIFSIWNLEIIYNYIDIFLFFLTQLLLVIPLIILIKSDRQFKTSDIENEFLFQISVLSILLSGFFFQINYSSTNFFLLILILSTAILLVNYLLNKSNKWIDSILSLLIFVILLKVFLLSSTKDAFHYSWYLGPINSISENYKLLDSVASQYGYLNILIINELSEFLDISTEYSLIGLIIFLFFVFYFLFFLKINKIINLPVTSTSIFLCFLIFGNIGHSNLAGSMFIPSSSVFRFLPSLITVLIFSLILESEYKKLVLLIFFYFSLLVSLFWSFESTIFIAFSFGMYFLSKLLNYLFYPKKTKINFIHCLKVNYAEFFLVFFLLIISFYLIIAKDFYLFYEHALNSEGSLSKEFLNNKITLIFSFLLLLAYLIMRTSFKTKYFFYNSLWFGLFVGYSLYFLVRSVDSNLINILPFILFIICSMKISSKYISNLRLNSIYVVIFFVIISSILSIIQNEQKFIDNFLSTNFINTPKYLDKNYLPNNTIINTIKRYPDIPITLVTGKTIHNKNLNLKQYGYGLPILPLEHFNNLNIDTKNKLINKFFEKNRKHLILCIYDCSFYSSNSDTNIRNKIFVGKKIKYKKIIEVDTKNSKEILYILSKF